jgi:hypothetical protein
MVAQYAPRWARSHQCPAPIFSLGRRGITRAADCCGLVSSEIAGCRECGLASAPSIFNPLRNCRSALFTTLAFQRSFLRRPRTLRRISQPRRWSPTSQPPRGRHLRSPGHQMPSSCNDPIQGSGRQGSTIKKQHSTRWRWACKRTSTRRAC